MAMDETTMEISYGEISRLPTEDYLLLDVRGEGAYQYGSIPGAFCVPDPASAAERNELPRDRLLVLFCMRGVQSRDQVAMLREMGYRAANLTGGYALFLKEQYAANSLQQKEKAAEVENALRKRRRFRDELFNRFAKAVVQYELVQPGDKIAVCISGGKDSMLMAKLFQELLRHRKFPFELVFLVMDPGYNEENRALLEANARLLGVPVTVFETRIFDAVDKVEKSPCYLCARMRRGWLYKKAKELGCNKIALGHHFDDVIETTLMSMLWGGQMQTMMPKLHSTNYPGMELIRPMYLVREDEIKAWRDFHGLQFLQCACHFTETCSSCGEDGGSASKRMETKKLIREMKKTNPNVEANIFNSAHNVSLDALIAYKTGGEKHHFLEKY